LEADEELRGRESRAKPELGEAHRLQILGSDIIAVLSAPLGVLFAVELGFLARHPRPRTASWKYGV
jgi:hypothetical protein